MAWALVENKEFASPSGAGTAYTFSPTSTIAVGTLIVLGWVANVNSATAATCADNSSQAGSANTYTALATQTSTGPSFAGGILYCVTTRAILATDVVTITSPSGSRRNGRMLTFTGVNAFDSSANEAAVTASPIDIGPTATLAETSELVVAASFWIGTSPSGVADSTSGYTLVASTGSGGTPNNVEVSMSYKTTAGTAAETDTHSFTALSKVNGQIAAFTQAAAVVAPPRRITNVRRVWAGR